MTIDNQSSSFPGRKKQSRSSFTLARRPSLGDEIYETLLAELISMKIAPGSRIAVETLVRKFGVSQTPIRAALIRLEAEGLVIKQHNIGYSAAPMPSRQKFEEIYDLRLLIEPYTAALAAKRLSENSVKELADMAQAMAQLGENDSNLAYSKFARQDAKFHARIAHESGNHLAAETLDRLYAHMHLFRLHFHSRVTEGAIQEHAQLIQAFRASDPVAASTAMHQHIAKSRERMSPFFELLD